MPEVILYGHTYRFLGLGVGADTTLTQSADFNCLIANLRNAIVDNSLRSVQVGQRIPAAWVKSASAPIRCPLSKGKRGERNGRQVVAGLFANVR
jgi:hypothetical protein